MTLATAVFVVIALCFFLEGDEPWCLGALSVAILLGSLGS